MFYLIEIYSDVTEEEAKAFLTKANVVGLQEHEKPPEVVVDEMELLLRKVVWGAYQKTATMDINFVCYENFRWEK